MGGGSYPKSKIFNSIKTTLGYDAGIDYGRGFKDSWPNDNPFTTTSTPTPITVGADKVTQSQTAMLEVFQWLYSSTMKPIVSSMSTLLVSSTSGSLPSDRDEWGNSIETYRVDEPPHSPGLSTESSSIIVFASFPAIEIIICVYVFSWVGLGALILIISIVRCIPTCTHVDV